MKTGEKIIKENPGMMRSHKNAHKKVDDLFRLYGAKEMYFILKRYYSYLESGYKPEFNI